MSLPRPCLPISRDRISGSGAEDMADRSPWETTRSIRADGDGSVLEDYVPPDGGSNPRTDRMTCNGSALSGGAENAWRILAPVAPSWPRTTPG